MSPAMWAELSWSLIPFHVCCVGCSFHSWKVPHTLITYFQLHIYVKEMKTNDDVNVQWTMHLQQQSARIVLAVIEYSTTEDGHCQNRTMPKWMIISADVNRFVWGSHSQQYVQWGMIQVEGISNRKLFTRDEKRLKVQWVKKLSAFEMPLRCNAM